jgi:hypothetical protein
VLQLNVDCCPLAAALRTRLLDLTHGLHFSAPLVLFRSIVASGPTARASDHYGDRPTDSFHPMWLDRPRTDAQTSGGLGRSKCRTVQAGRTEGRSARHISEHDLSLSIRQAILAYASQYTGSEGGDRANVPLGEDTTNFVLEEYQRIPVCATRSTAHWIP